MEKLFACTLGLEKRGRAESGVWGTERNKEGEQRRDAPAGEEFGCQVSLAWVSWVCDTLPAIPNSAARGRRNSVLAAGLGSNPLVGRDWKREVPGTTF